MLTLPTIHFGCTATTPPAFGASRDSDLHPVWRAAASPVQGGRNPFYAPTPNGVYFSGKDNHMSDKFTHSWTA
ncbi:MAG: hypothetical protein AB7P76_10385 [Candidatus Melainabacteria bacterium]